MKTKLFAVMAFSMVAISMAATAMTGKIDRDDPDDAAVQAAIDSRLHDLLVQKRMQREAR